LFTGILASLCPLLFTQFAMGIVCVVGFWLVYLAVAGGAAVLFGRADNNHRAIGSDSWSPRAGLIFGLSRAAIFVVAGLEAQRRPTPFLLGACSTWRRG
jgi:amino acid transporter